MSPWQHCLQSISGCIIEPHGRGVNEVVPKSTSPPELRRCPHEGGLLGGKRPFGTTEGTSRRVVLFLLYPRSP